MHGTTSVMRMCRAGQQMLLLGPLGSVPGSLSLFTLPPPPETSPGRSCAPCATALARPLLFTGFACHVRVRPSVGHSRTCVLTVTHLFLFLFLLWQNAFASLQPAPASLLPSRRAQCLCNLRRQCLQWSRNLSLDQHCCCQCHSTWHWGCHYTGRSASSEGLAPFPAPCA